MLSANATVDAMKECENANIDVYLTKPIDAKKLLSTIKSLASIRSNRACELLPHNSTDKKMGVNCDNLILDSEVLNNLSSLDNDKRFIEGLINGFFKDAKDLLSRLEASVAERNYSAFSDHIHALKGSSGSIGALALYVRCKEIRSDAQTNTDYVSVLRSLNKIYKQTEDALSHYLSSQYAAKA